METTQLNAPLVAPMRWLLYLAAFLVFGVGVPLLLAPAYTDLYFPFPIDPPITAGFLGACYVAAGVLELMSARAPRWGAARVGVPGVLVFTLLTCVTTLTGLERFNGPRAVVWIWTAVYALTPPALGYAWWIQHRHARRFSPMDGAQPASAGTPLPVWARAVFGVIGLALTAFGLWLRVSPERAGELWPWALSSPTSYAGAATMEPYAGAWLVGLGFVALGMAEAGRQDDVRPAAASAVLLCLLIALVLVRDAENVRWTTLPGTLLIGLLIALGATSACCLSRSRRFSRP